MVVVVLVVFLVTEVLQVVLHVWFSARYIDDSFRMDKIDNNFVSYKLVLRYEDSMATLLADYTDMISGSEEQRNIVYIFITEGIRLFTLVGCMSNFIIYIAMSGILRSEIMSIFRGPVNRTNEIEMRPM